MSITSLTIFPSWSTVTATITESVWATPSLSPASADFSTEDITANPVFTESSDVGSSVAGAAGSAGAACSVTGAAGSATAGSWSFAHPAKANKDIIMISNNTNDFFIVILHRFLNLYI